MKRNIKFFMALVIFAGLLVGMVGTGSRASAHVLADTLPVTKTPSSSHFDFSGNLKSSDGTGTDLSLQLNGTGATSGSDIQEDETVNLQLPPLLGGGSTSNEPITVTTSVILTGGKAYIKYSGLGAGSDNQWYETDLSGTTGLLGTSMIGSMMGGPSNMAGLDPAYSDAYKVTTLGKQTVEGAPTTEYRVDVDLQKLLSALSPSSPPSSLAGLDYQFYILMWIGDNDQYVHKLTETLNANYKSGGTQSNTSLNLTLTFRDFDTPITISAPANALPLDSSALGSLSGGGISGIGTIGGMPTSAGGALGMPGMTGVGMPKTGGHTPGELPILPISLALAAMLSLVGGFALRRAASR